MEGSKITIRGGVWSLDGSVEIVEEREATLPEEDVPSAPKEKDKNSSEESEDIASRYNIGSLAKLGDPAKCPVLQKLANKQSHSYHGAISGCPVMKGIANHLSLGNADDANKESSLPESSLLESSLPESHQHLLSSDNPSNEGLTTAKREGEETSPEPPSKRPRVHSTAKVVRSFAGIVPPAHLCGRASVAQKLGREVADALLKRGAAEVLAKAKAENNMAAPNTKPVKWSWSCLSNFMPIYFMLFFRTITSWWLCLKIYNFVENVVVSFNNIFSIVI